MVRNLHMSAVRVHGEYVLADHDVLVPHTEQRARAAPCGKDVLAAMQADSRIVRVKDAHLVSSVAAHLADTAYHRVNTLQVTQPQQYVTVYTIQGFAQEHKKQNVDTIADCCDVTYGSRSRRRIACWVRSTGIQDTLLQPNDSNIHHTCNLFYKHEKTV